MSEQVTAAEVLAFWIDEVGPTGWYNSTEALDETIRSRFLGAWEQGAAGGLSDWLQNAEGALAYVILLDQFPRNMFRGAGQAFATDKKALCAAKCAITKGWDLKTGEPARQFFYLPLMHSECLSDQDRCIRLMKERMPETGGKQSAPRPRPPRSHSHLWPLSLSQRGARAPQHRVGSKLHSKRRIRRHSEATRSCIKDHLSKAYRR